MAVELARAERIMFTDDDSAVPTGWVATMCNSFDLEPGVAMIYCNDVLLRTRAGVEPIPVMSGTI